MSSARKHNRKLGLLGASLTMARPPKFTSEVANEVRDEVEAIMIASNYLEGAPFEWVTLALRYGLENEDKPHYQKIDRKYGDLPLGIEIDTHEMLEADREELKRLFTRATLISLIHAGHKYGRPTQALEDRLSNLSDQIC